MPFDDSQHLDDDNGLIDVQVYPHTSQRLAGNHCDSLAAMRKGTPIESYRASGDGHHRSRRNINASRA